MNVPVLGHLEQTSSYFKSWLKERSRSSMRGVSLACRSLLIADPLKRVYSLSAYGYQDFCFGSISPMQDY